MYRESLEKLIHDVVNDHESDGTGVLELSAKCKSDEATGLLTVFWCSRPLIPTARICEFIWCVSTADNQVPIMGRIKYAPTSEQISGYLEINPSVLPLAEYQGSYVLVIVTAIDSFNARLTSVAVAAVGDAE
jgi:hypothetical protein